MKQIRLQARQELSEERSKYGSQREFADVLRLYIPGISQSTVAKWELGQRKLTMDKAKIVAMVLNKRLDQLFVLPVK